MKRLFICIFLGFFLGITSVIVTHEILKNKRIATFVESVETSITEEPVEPVILEPEKPVYEKIFDEDENMTEETFLISEKEIKIPVLLYHEFYEEEPDKKLYGSVSTPEKFEKDLLNIVGEGFKVISLNRMIDYKNGVKGIPKNSVVITFDDGYMSNYTLIYPILKKYKIPATIFIIEDLLGTEGYMTWEEAQIMNGEGLVTIYSHGFSHVDMTSLMPNDFASKISNNFAKMEEMLGKPEHLVYSYPYGFYNKETNTILKDMGVEAVMTTDKGLNDVKDLEAGIIRRDYVAYNFSGLKILRILNGK